MVLFSVDLPCGNGEMSIKESSNSWTPKLFKAEPKNTGAIFPSRYFSLSNSSYTPSTNSTSSFKISVASSPIKSESAWS